MPSAPRSVFNPHPCTREEELHNWNALARLLSRIPLEPRSEDDGKILVWHNTTKRYVLTNPCVATELCGGGASDPCEFCTGATTPATIAARISTATPLDCTTGDCNVLTAAAFTLTRLTSCYYQYSGVFMCNGMEKSMILDATLQSGQISGSLTIASVPERSWTISGLGATYDCSVTRILTANSGNGPHCDLTGSTLTLN